MTTPESDASTGGVSEQTLNRNWTELVQELRATQIGVQVLIGFLLAVPYTDRFHTLDHLEKAAYLLVLSLAVAATAAVLAPIAYHRILFRRGLRPWLVETANVIARAGLVLAALSMCGVVFLAFDLAAGTAAGVTASVVAAITYVVLWLVVPLRAHPPGRSG
jgi:predicted exporter